MSAQPSLFGAHPAAPPLDVQPKRLDVPFIYTLPEVCVLRDWLLERGTLLEMQVRYIDPCQLVDMGPRDLAACALDAVCAYLRTRPQTLQFPTGRGEGRMRPEELLGGFAVHVEALKFAHRWGLETHPVRTRIEGRNSLSRARDIVYLVGCVVHVDRGQPGGAPECTLPLVAGWQKEQRRGRVFPWDPPPPGWVVDRKACRLVRSTQPGWVPRAAYREAERPVEFDLRNLEHRPGAEVHRATFVEGDP